MLGVIQSSKLQQLELKLESVYVVSSSVGQAILRRHLDCLHCKCRLTQRQTQNALLPQLGLLTLICNVCSKLLELLLELEPVSTTCGKRQRIRSPTGL